MSAALELDLPRSSELTIRKLQPTIGAQIDGVDLRHALPSAIRDAIRDAVLKHKVVFFRDQHITREQQADFARQFGPLYVHPSTKRPDHDRLPAIHHIVPRDDLTPEAMTVLDGTTVRRLPAPDGARASAPCW